MAEFGSFSLPSPKNNYKKVIGSSFFSLPRLFTSFTVKGFSEIDSVISPTSILDTKPFSFSTIRNSFWSDNTSSSSSSPRNTDTEHKRSHWEKKKIESVGIGLGIVDALKDESFDPKQPKPETRPVVFFGSKLKIQVPPLPFSVPPNPESASPRSPPNFGIKSRNSQLGFASPRLSRSLDTTSRSGSSSNSHGLGVPASPRVLSASKMELSEDYTCVITHGPNPKTTHIFDDCIVESCCGDFGFASDMKENGFLSDEHSGSLSQSFLSICCTCKKNLGQGSDIYMYRGEKAFCSGECRYQEILLEERMGRSEPDEYGFS
ncbi:FCS-Like Zinc finger 8-like [Rhodamnia argentea]|uniref:FCS-Like Zinc finger 8-like n=1 Tax=Rhodamnia argentea TaxID=178133 RepID=A0A8B8PMZ1_9MYRT|nr:FCS-Like Zinc finger 8-like [Rhodamnia argentea]